MIELLFIACLKTSPDVCEEKTMSFLTSGRSSPAVCTMHAMQQLAEWSAQHPAYTVTTWRCQDPGSREIRA